MNTDERKAYDHRSYLKRKQRRDKFREARRRVCVECGEAFNNFYAISKVCSALCRDIRRRKQQGISLASPVKLQAKLKRCKFCGKEFCAANDRFEYCSKRCVQRRGALAYPDSPESLLRQKKKRQTPAHKLARNAKLRERMARDPVFKLRALVSKQVWRALKKLKSSKSDSTLKFLPYSMPQLKAHLEAQFNNANGFTWENHGKLWHIDHIVPHSLFTYTELDSKAFRDCWALSNLRPLKADENIRKSNRLLAIATETCPKGYWPA